MELWCGAFSPETFFEQTAQTFYASLKGRGEARAERDLILSYQTGAFSSSTKVKPLRHYLDQLRRPEDVRIANAKMIARFHAMKARGLPVKITRVPRKDN